VIAGAGFATGSGVKLCGSIGGRRRDLAPPPLSWPDADGILNLHHLFHIFFSAGLLSLPTFLEGCMRKLKLDLEDLEVESFRTGGHARRAGTVLGNDATTVVQEKEEDLPEDDTTTWYHWTVFIYEETELDTCGYTCNYSCPQCEA
jgi:hypothetical protein